MTIFWGSPPTCPTEFINPRLTLLTIGQNWTQLVHGPRVATPRPGTTTGSRCPEYRIAKGKNAGETKLLNPI